MPGGVLWKGVLRNFAKSTGKHFGQSLFFNKVPGWPATLSKKKVWRWYFPTNFAKFLRTHFLTEHFRSLLLRIFPYYSKERQKSSFGLSTLRYPTPGANVVLIYIITDFSRRITKKHSWWRPLFTPQPIISLKSDSHLSKKMFLFASMIALQKWWKMFFISP